MSRYIVMTAAACMPGPLKFGTYKRVAVVETDGVRMPKQINPRHAAVRSIPFLRDRLNVGTTDRCAFRRALADAEAVAAQLNAQAV